MKYRIDKNTNYDDRFSWLYAMAMGNRGENINDSLLLAWPNHSEVYESFPNYETTYFDFEI